MPERRSDAVAETALANVRVLIVDDTVDSLEMLQLSLQLEGAQVFAAGSADDAFELLERETVDVLVTDLGMPGTDGYGLLRCVRKDRPDHNGFIPAIAVSGFASPEDRAATAAAGFRAHFSKPVDRDELVAKIRELAHE